MLQGGGPSRWQELVVVLRDLWTMKYLAAVICEVLVVIR